jgi:hypothetical protein
LSVPPSPVAVLYTAVQVMPSSDTSTRYALA